MLVAVEATQRAESSEPEITLALACADEGVAGEQRGPHDVPGAIHMGAMLVYCDRLVRTRGSYRSYTTRVSERASDTIARAGSRCVTTA